MLQPMYPLRTTFSVSPGYRLLTQLSLEKMAAILADDIFKCIFF